jgi:hypothetical protein
VRLFMIISHVKIIAFQLSLFCKNYRFSKTVLYIINRKIYTWVLGNTRFISRVEHDISLVRSAHSWDIMFNPRNRSGISVHPCIILYILHKVWIWGILQSDWFSTSRILAHILLVEKNKMVAQTEFLTFCERQNCKLFAFYSLHRIKNTIKKLPQIVYRLANEFLKFKMVKDIYFWKTNRPKERR